MKSGNYYWNSGIFVWKVKTIIHALNKFKPDLNGLFEFSTGIYNSNQEQSHVNEAFLACEDISIDFAVLENAKNVRVVLADFGWSDLGTWGSLYTHLDKDFEGNAVIGNEVHLFESENCIVNMPENKLVVLQGLDGYIAVESDGVLMVVKREDEQKIKAFLSEVKKQSTHFSD